MAGKYSKDGEFCDPVVRCEGCKKITKVETLRRVGVCPECGNRRMRNVTVFNGDELAWMKAQCIDADFIALFEEVTGVRA